MFFSIQASNLQVVRPSAYWALHMDTRIKYRRHPFVNRKARFIRRSIVEFNLIIYLSVSLVKSARFVRV